MVIPPVIPPVIPTTQQNLAFKKKLRMFNNGLTVTHPVTPGHTRTLHVWAATSRNL